MIRRLFRTNTLIPHKAIFSFRRFYVKKSNHEIEWNHPYHHHHWTREQLQNIRITHHNPITISDKLTYRVVKWMRYTFDYLTGFQHNSTSENQYLHRILFLETIAGVPGMVAGMIRHLHSLRTMKKDHGWINTLLEEASNERMHLLTFLELKQPSFSFRMAVIISQGIFFNTFFLAYLIHPHGCHRFVGYLEEEAVKTYTNLIQEIDDHQLPLFQTMKVPSIAIDYWKLSSDATFRDLLLVIRADEANHRLVNHTLSDVQSTDVNPFSL